MSQCVPPIPIRPCVLKYLGKTHNLWFRSTLMLEHQAFEKGLSLQIKPKQTTEFYEQESITPPQQVRPPSCVNYIFLANDVMVSKDISQVILSSNIVKLLYWGEKSVCHEHSKTMICVFRRYWTPLQNFTLCYKRKICGLVCGRSVANILRQLLLLLMNSMDSLSR